mmetsp:Transcript_24702/g.57385  ORF Transcript_24702/g.57385 Transcript_24702/m.57385 type:complete len:210 (-) Transcript_24702:30-659(-)
MHLLAGRHSHDEGVGASGLVSGAVLLQHHGKLSHNGELEPLLVHLQGVVTAALLILKDGSVDDLDRTWVGTMTTRHLLVHLANSVVDVHITVLLVHVVGVGATLVPQPDPVVLHLVGLLVLDFIHCQQLATTLLGLAHLLHEVPEPRLGHDSVFCKQSHPVNFWRRVFVSGRRAAHNLVLVHLRRQTGVRLEAFHHLAWQGSGPGRFAL